ncbi:hypothetical protein ALC62_10441, partial [Cyphomyrmex costatus]
RLPINKPELLDKWLKNMKMKINFQPSSKMRKCSEHFLDECIIVKNSNRMLKSDSIPVNNKSSLRRLKDVIKFCRTSEKFTKSRL